MKIINAIEDQVTPFKEGIKRRKLTMLIADRDAIAAALEGVEITRNSNSININPWEVAREKKYGWVAPRDDMEAYREFYSMKRKAEKFDRDMREVTHVMDQLREKYSREDVESNPVKIKTDEELEVMAADFAELVWMDFINKMTVKFDKFGEAREVEFYGDDPIENQMVVKFDNECEFTVNNSIVWKYSNRGTHFCQFPMRFTAPKRYGKKLKDLSTQKGCQYLSNL